MSKPIYEPTPEDAEMVRALLVMAAFIWQRGLPAFQALTHEVDKRRERERS